MRNGYFSTVSKHPDYAKLDKNWLVLLQNTQVIWASLLDDTVSKLGYAKQIRQGMKTWHAGVEATTDKLFVYFIATRHRVRFCILTAPIIRPDGMLLADVLVGKDKTRFTIGVPLAMDAQAEATQVELVGDNGIRITIGQSITTFSVHDLLSTFDVRLGIHTEIHYVGSTKNPAKRPMSLGHDALSRIMLSLSNEDYDFFLVYNVFKAMALARDDDYMLNYYLANSVTGPVSGEGEGRLIEKLLIRYFDPKLQNRNAPAERSSLIRRMGELAHKHRISSVAVDMAIVDTPSEYFSFCSSSAPASLAHAFTCKFMGNEVAISPGAISADDFFGKQSSSSLT